MRSAKLVVKSNPGLRLHTELRLLRAAYDRAAVDSALQAGDADNAARIGSHSRSPAGTDTARVETCEKPTARKQNQPRQRPHILRLLLHPVPRGKRRRQWPGWAELCSQAGGLIVTRIGPLYGRPGLLPNAPRRRPRPRYGSNRPADQRWPLVLYVRTFAPKSQGQ